MQQFRRSTPTHSQNALTSGALVDRLLRASSIQAGDLVYDLGAGSGVISARLARRQCEVIAVEIDAALADRLRIRFAETLNVQVRECDALEVRLPARPYKVFSNIPFDMTADVLARLARTPHPPEDTYLVVQREAAERFIGKPRTTLAAVLLYPWFEANGFYRFRRTDFRPVPRVDIVMLRLRKRRPPLLAQVHAQLYRDFMVRMFTGPTGSVSHRLEVLLGGRRGRRVANTLNVGDLPPGRIPTSVWLEVFEASASLRDDLNRTVAHGERWLREQQRRLEKVHRTRARRLRPPPGLTAGDRHGAISRFCARC
jgi:23S rRNA (adenine-N6)-dimethyltransferase